MSDSSTMKITKGRKWSPWHSTPMTEDIFDCDIICVLRIHEHEVLWQQFRNRCSPLQIWVLLIIVYEQCSCCGRERLGHARAVEQSIRRDLLVWQFGKAIALYPCEKLRENQAGQIDPFINIVTLNNSNSKTRYIPFFHQISDQFVELG